MYNVRMSDGRHNLNLPSDANKIRLRFDFTFLYGLDGNFLSRLLVDAKLHFAICALA